MIFPKPFLFLPFEFLSEKPTEVPFNSPEVRIFLMCSLTVACLPSNNTSICFCVKQMDSTCPSLRNNHPSLFTFWYFWFLLFGLSGIVILIFSISSKGLIYFSEKFLLPANPRNSCISFRLRGTEQNWIRSCIVTCSLSCSFEANSIDGQTRAVVASDRGINSHNFLLVYFTYCINH